jgi:hypothetical protein
VNRTQQIRYIGVHCEIEPANLLQYYGVFDAATRMDVPDALHNVYIIVNFKYQ